MKSLARFGVAAALAVSAWSWAQNDACQVLHQEIDCSRLTKAECTELKKARDRLNLNRQTQCNQEQSKQARAEASGNGNGGAGNGSGNGNGNGEAGTNQNGNAGTNGTNTTPTSGQSSGDLAGILGETVSDKPESHSGNANPASGDNTAQGENASEQGIQSTGVGGSAKEKMDWGKSDLCQKAREAHKKASTDAQKQSMQKLVKKYCD